MAIEAIVASGSAVRDVEYSDDLDLLIVYRTYHPSLPRPPIDVDLRHYERADVLRKLKDGHDYLSWTVRYGRALFERDAWWARLSVEWNDLLPLPSATEARERARRARRLYDEMPAIGDRDAAAELRTSMLTFLARAALSSAGVFPKSRAGTHRPAARHRRAGARRPLVRCVGPQVRITAGGRVSTGDATRPPTTDYRLVRVKELRVVSEVSVIS